LSKGKIIKGFKTEEFGMPSFEEVVEPGESSNISLEDRIALIEKEAYEQGFKAGEKAGFEIGTEKAAKLIEAVEKILTELDSLKKNMITELQPQIFELSVAIAKKIIRQEIKQNPDIILHLIEEAMRKIERTGTIIIKIHPLLKDLFEKHRPHLLEIHDEIKFDIDPSVEPSGPVVIGPNEEVTVDFESQITNLLEELSERLQDDNP